MTIDAEKLDRVFRDCLFTEDEAAGGVPVDAVIVEGILHKYSFHPGRLESYRAEVSTWLKALPHVFRENEGSGMSFLNACVDEDGNRWGEHINMGQLFDLGCGLKLAKACLPRDMWSFFPGGMPYYSISV